MTSVTILMINEGASNMNERKPFQILLPDMFQRVEPLETGVNMNIHSKTQTIFYM